MREILCNKYEVLKTIAEGGMGCVYLVKDLHLNRLCAVKVSKGREEQNRSVAVAEKEMLGRLSHPALPAILDFFEEKGRLCIVMEYVEGITLEQYMRKFGVIREETAVEFMLTLCDVLQYLHGQNPPIIYRDLKPANIMVQPDGNLKLIDLGGAGLFGRGSQDEQFVPGTPGYCAPEQWKSGRAGKSSDIYSMGVIFHEMLTGIRTEDGWTERHPVREYDRGISGELQRIIENCLKKRPRDRYQSTEEMKEALLAFKEGRRRLRIPWKRGIMLFLFLLTAASVILPLLKGVPETEFPFPFLQVPCLLLAFTVLNYRLLYGRAGRKQFIRKREKSILLTEKPFPGMYVAGFLLSFLLGTGLTKEFSHAAVVQAAEEKEELFVELRDEEGRKLLLREGAYLPVKKRVRLEISGEDLPEGMVSLQLFTTQADGQIRKSRIFLLENV